MAYREMAEARENMMLGHKKPAMWLMSPSAEAKLRRETKQTSAHFFNLPIRVIDAWSWGWVLLDTDRAGRLGITDLD